MKPRALAAAVTARCQSSTFLTYGQGQVEDRPVKGYTVLYYGSGAPFGDRHSGGANRLRWTVRAKCVGYTVDQLLFVAEQVRSRLLGWSPDPDLSAGWLAEVDDDPPVLPDDSVAGDVRYSLTLTYTLTTTARS